MVREGLRMFLQLSKQVEIVGEADSGEAAIKLADGTTIDVMLMDLLMPGQYDGIAAIREIKSRHEQVRILALTSSEEPERMQGAINAGAIGYLQKDVSPDDLLGAIRQAAAGRTVLEAAALRAIQKATPLHRAADPQKLRSANAADESVRVDPLTPREQAVLEQMALGCSNKEIAGKLGITEKTVKVHVSHILSKLGVYDRTQAILAASRLGLVELK